MRLSPRMASPPRERIAWIDALRLLGALLIFVYDFAGDWRFVFGEPASVSGLAAVFADALPHFAEWAISLFVILAGLSLTLAWQPGADAGHYFKRRALRLLLPLWIVGVPYTATGLALGLMPIEDLWKAPFWLLGLGVVNPATYLPVSQAWWYVTLALQCALIVPVVMWLLNRIGTRWTLSTLVAVELLSLWAILQLPSEWHYLAQGLVFARLLEFGVGVLAAQVLRRRTAPLESVALALLLAVAGRGADRSGAITSGATIISWTVLVLGLSLALGDRPASSRLLLWVGLATYPFYLSHAPIGKYTIRVLGQAGIDSPWLVAGLALSLTTVAAFAVTRMEGGIASRLRFGTPA